MRSFLVVGNQTLDSPELEAAIVDRMAAGPAAFHVVVPATPIALFVPAAMVPATCVPCP